MKLMTREIVEQLPPEVKKAVIKEYLQTTYYWSVGLLSFIVGVLLALLIK
jgi:bifunctional DNase/RNase